LVEGVDEVPIGFRGAIVEHHHLPTLPELVQIVTDIVNGG
jgi:hypothetical protein